MKIVAVNKSASFEYFIEEKYEAGIVLQGNDEIFKRSAFIRGYDFHNITPVLS